MVVRKYHFLHRSRKHSMLGERMRGHDLITLKMKSTIGSVTIKEIEYWTSTLCVCLVN